PFGPFLALGALLALYRPSVTLPGHLGQGESGRGPAAAPPSSLTRPRPAVSRRSGGRASAPSAGSQARGARAVPPAAAPRPGRGAARDALAASGSRLRGPPRAWPRPLRRARRRRERHHHARGGRTDAQRDREPARPREGAMSGRATARRPRAGFSVVEALVGAALAGIALAGLAAVAGLATASLRLARDPAVAP